MTVGRWQNFDDGTAQNRHPFGADLHAFLWAESQVKLLQQCGWLDGGCLILASAVRTWSLDQCGVAAWVRPDEQSPGGLLVDHYAATLCDEGKLLFIDGDGIGTEDDFIEKMSMELVQDGFLMPDALALFDAACAGQRPCHEANLALQNPSALLARRLGETFGAFSMDRIWLDWPEEHSCEPSL